MTAAVFDNKNAKFLKLPPKNYAEIQQMSSQMMRWHVVQSS